MLTLNMLINDNYILIYGIDFEIKKKDFQKYIIISYITY